MKHILIAFIIVLFIGTKAYAMQPEMDELIDLAQFMDEEGFIIEHWETTFRENITEAKIADVLKEMKRIGPVKRTENNKIIKYLTKYVHKSSEIVETYSIVYPKDNFEGAELIVVLEGALWDHKIKEKYDQRRNSINNLLFTKTVKRFACLTTNMDAIIKDRKILEKITQKYKLKYISTQIDEISDVVHKKNIYGYTPLWTQKILLEDRPMNMQIALTAVKNREKKLVIGTPILINEY